MKKIIVSCFVFSCVLGSNAQSLLKVDENDELRPKFYFEKTECQGDCEELYSLHTVIDSQRSTHPIIADYNKEIYEGDSIMCMRPRYNLNPKIQYIIKVADQFIDYRIDIEEGKTDANITAVYPISEEIPSNLLTMYISFDTPMRPSAKAFHYVILQREDGTEIAEVWRHRAVWQNNNTVLALMIHPGRIKKGIVSTSELEEVFPVGENISVVLKEGLLTQDGTPVGAQVLKNYHIAEDHRKKVSQKVKLINEPNFNTQQPLIIAFKQKMDYGLINKWVCVERNGEYFDGNLITMDDYNWQFVPNVPWNKGEYTVLIDYKIGDPSHNNMNRLFEEKTVKSFEKEASQNKKVVLSFNIK